MFVCPFPSVLQEFLAGEVALLDALFGEFLHHLGFGSDRGMVGTWHPASILAQHTCAAHENILDGIVEHVAHVKHTRHVGWGDDHCIGLAAVGLRVEEFVV